MSALRPFWFPISALIEVLERPFDTPALGVLAWIGTLTAVAGLYLCVRRRIFTPLLVLLALLPSYFGMVYLGWQGPRHQRDTVIFAGMIGGLLSLAVAVFGLVRDRGTRTAATLMLPLNAVFLLGLLILTGMSVYRR